MDAPSQTTALKTPLDIELLKTSWHNDPCYDLEDAEGFEAHHDELLRYRLEIEAAWHERQKRRAENKAIALGVRGNLDLADAVLHLEDRIRDFERRISLMEDR